jgi:hypothetical protein
MQKIGDLFRTRNSLLITGALLAVFFLSSFAYATTFVDIPFPEWVKQTPSIVHGKVGGSYTDWSESGPAKKIYTFYTVQVDEVLKGGASTSDGPIIIRELGGEKDGLGMQVAGAAQFSRGEDVVVFLNEENHDGSYEVRGLSGGKLNLKLLPDGRQCLSGTALNQQSECQWTLADLKRVIQAQAQTQRQESQRQPQASNVSSPIEQKAMTVLPSRSPSLEPSEQAPQLQPSPQLSSQQFGRVGLWQVIGLVTIVGLLLFKRSKR